MKENDNKYTDSIKKARDHLVKKEYKNARLMYFQAFNSTENKKDRSIIWAELSWVYYYEKDMKKAIEAAENVQIYDPEYQMMDDINRLLGYCYLGLKNYPLAEKYMSESLGINSEDDKQQYVKYELGKLHFILGRYDLAFPYFKDIEEFFRRTDQEYHLSVIFYLGFIHYYLEAHENSREYFEQILSSTKDKKRWTGAYLGLAFLEFRSKNYLNVISLCEKIVELDEHFFDMESIGFLTAASYYYLGRKDIFMEYYSQLVETYPAGRYRKELEIFANSEPELPKDSNKQG